MDKERQVVRRPINNRHPGVFQVNMSETNFLDVFVVFFSCVGLSSDFSLAPAQSDGIISHLTDQLPCRSIRAEQTGEPGQESWPQQTSGELEHY